MTSWIPFITPPQTLVSPPPYYTLTVVTSWIPFITPPQTLVSPPPYYTLTVVTSWIPFITPPQTLISPPPYYTLTVVTSWIPFITPPQTLISPPPYYTLTVVTSWIPFITPPQTIISPTLHTHSGDQLDPLYHSLQELSGLLLLATVVGIAQAHEDHVSRNARGVAFHLLQLKVQHQCVEQQVEVFVLPRQDAQVR